MITLNKLFFIAIKKFIIVGSYQIYLQRVLDIYIINTCVFIYD
jgi:hypothetical protein